MPMASDKLLTLQLEHNQLTGPIPNFTTKSTSTSPLQLELLYLEFNDLTGPIPASLGSLSALKRLTLNGNSLSGVVPPSFCSLASLVECQLPAGGRLAYDCNTSCPDILEGLCAQRKSDCVVVDSCLFDLEDDTDSDMICGDVDSCRYDALNRWRWSVRWRRHLLARSHQRCRQRRCVRRSRLLSGRPLNDASDLDGICDGVDLCLNDADNDVDNM